MSLTALSGIIYSIIIGIVQIFVIVLLVCTSGIDIFLDDYVIHDKQLLRTAGIILIIQAVLALFTTSISGILVRVLYALGYYPRMTWWGALVALNSALVPAIVVSMGGTFFLTGLVLAISTLCCYLLVYIDVAHLFFKEKILLRSFSWKLGWLNFRNSLILAVKEFFENFRQQGVRIILSPLSGASTLVMFTTLRTGANVTLQGLNTITNPLMPELMRFIHQRNQDKVEAAFGTIWIVVMIFLAPGVVTLQMFVEPLFLMWTQGRVPFDELAFALLSLSVLVYALAQPANAIVMGNNLSKQQLILSALAASIVVMAMFILVPMLGVRGAAASLLLAEIVSCMGYTFVAKKWMTGNGLQWPTVPFQVVTFSIFAVGVAMALLIMFPNLKWAIFSVVMTLLGINAWRYWQVLPVVATQQTLYIINKIFFKAFAMKPKSTL